MVADAKASEPIAPRREDHFVHFVDATWADYQRLLGLRGERSVLRITYLEGRLEIMSPSRTHAAIASAIGRLVEVYCAHRGIEYSPYGSWTLEDKEAERGAEPDECYIFAGKDKERDRPDLAIEVVWTSGGLSKLEVYRKLRVKEVWYWKKGRITPHVLRGEVYEEVPASEVLAGIDLELLASFLDRQPVSAAQREYRAALEART